MASALRSWRSASRSAGTMRYFFAIFGRLSTSATSSTCPGTRRSTKALPRQASISCRCKPRVLRRLLTSWFVSGSALSTPPTSGPAPGLPYVVLDLAIRDGREPAADPVHDLEPSFALGDHPLELL